MSFRDRLAEARPDISVISDHVIIHWTHDDPGFERPAYRCRPLTDRGRMLLAHLLITTHDWDWVETYRATYGVRPSGMTPSETTIGLLRRVMDGETVFIVTRSTEADWKAFEAWLEGRKREARAESTPA